MLLFSNTLLQTCTAAHLHQLDAAQFSPTGADVG